MSKANSRTIAFRAGESHPLRKLTKIVSYRAQGFAVLMPYHSAKSGFVAKVPVDYKKLGGFRVHRDDMIGFTSESRVKLSYHPDGFAQFSGEVQGKVISGRDPVSGEPKGVGLLTSPLTEPISSGPSCGITAWGFEDYDEFDKSASKSAMVFECDEFYYRNTTPSEANGLVLEVFVLPKRYWSGVRRRGADYILAIAREDFEASRAVLELKVIELPEQDILLACLASLVRVSFPSPSGWILGGPGIVRADGTGEMLMASYPRFPHMAEGKEPLDREQQP